MAAQSDQIPGQDLGGAGGTVATGEGNSGGEGGVGENVQLGVVSGGSMFESSPPGEIESGGGVLPVEAGGGGESLTPVVESGGAVLPPVPPGPMTPSGETPFVSGEEGKKVDTVVVPPGESRNLPVLPIILGVFLMVVLGVAGWFFLSRMKGGTGGVVTVKYWGLWEDTGIIEPVISEFNQNHPEMKVVYEVQNKEDYRERLQSALTAGNGPDVFRFHNTWVPMLAKELAPVPASVASASEFEAAYYPVVKKDLLLGVNYMGVPLMIEGLGLYVNDEIFRAAGKTPPATWDELEKTAVEMTVRDEAGRIKVAGVALGNTVNVDNWSDILGLMFLQNGANLSNPTGKLAEDALKFYTLFQSRDRVWDETMPPSTKAFAGGKVAMILAPSWRAHEVADLAPKLEFRILPVPQLPDVDPAVNWASYWVEGVAKQSKNQEVAWAFVKFLASKETMMKLYENESKVRPFGEPYARRDMASLIIDQPLVGAYVKQAETAKSWYLASRTWDGEGGIDSKMIKYFEDAVNAVSTGKTVEEATKTLAAGVAQVLNQYGISAKAAN